MFCPRFPFFSFFHLLVPLGASFAIVSPPTRYRWRSGEQCHQWGGDVNCSLGLQLFERMIVSLGHCSLLWSSTLNPGPHPEIRVCFSFCSSPVFPRNTGSISYAVKVFCSYCRMQKKKKV
ncbi:unnamed protein product, partial [Ixodes pacificus]